MRYFRISFPILEICWWETKNNLFLFGLYNPNPHLPATLFSFYCEVCMFFTIFFFQSICLQMIFNHVMFDSFALQSKSDRWTFFRYFVANWMNCKPLTSMRVKCDIYWNARMSRKSDSICPIIKLNDLLRNSGICAA